MFNDEIGAVISVVRLLSVIGLLAACGGSLAGSLAVESVSPGLRWLQMDNTDMRTTPSESIAGRHFEIYLDYRSKLANDAHWIVNNGSVPQATLSDAKAKGVVDRACVPGTPVLLPPAHGMDR